MASDAPLKTEQALLDSFLHKKDIKKNIVAQKAQKLINLYRHLHFFGTDFISAFNRDLLNAPQEVQMVLGDFIGGQTVRQYLDFLKAQQDNTSDTNQQKDGNPTAAARAQAGYLPTPDMDRPMMPTTGIPFKAETQPTTSLATGGGAHSLKNLMQTLISMHQNESMKQAVFLEEAMKRLQEGLTQKIDTIGTNHTGNTTSPEVCFDIDAFQKKQQETLNRTLENVMQAQTQIFTQALEKINENAQKLAVSQTERLIHFIESQNTKEEKPTRSKGAESFTSTYCKLPKNKIIKDSQTPYYPTHKEIEIVPETDTDSDTLTDNKEPTTHE